MDIVQNAPPDYGKILFHRLAKLVLKENIRRRLVPSQIRARIVLKVDLLEKWIHIITVEDTKNFKLENFFYTEALLPGFLKQDIVRVIEFVQWELLMILKRVKMCQMCARYAQQVNGVEGPTMSLANAFFAHQEHFPRKLGW